MKKKFSDGNKIQIDSLVAQMAKNLPAMQTTCIWSLGWEDSLENPHSSILA